MIRYLKLSSSRSLRLFSLKANQPMKSQVTPKHRTPFCEYFKSRFKSKVNSIDLDKVYQLLSAMELDPRQTHDHIKLKICPVCPKPHNDDPTNFNTMSIHKEKLVYHCFRCGNKGHLLRLIKLLNNGKSREFLDLGLQSGTTTSENEDMNYRRGPANIVLDDYPAETPTPRRAELIQTANQLPLLHQHSKPQDPKDLASDMKLMNTKLLGELCKRFHALENENVRLIRDYITNERKLRVDVLRLYRVGFSYEKFLKPDNGHYNLPCVTFPLFIPNSCFTIIKPEKGKIHDDVYNELQCERFFLSKIKLRAIGKELKKFQRIEPSGAFAAGLFGINTVPDDADTLVITEGEFDAMAVFQELGLPAVSLPNGCSSLPSELLPIFSRFSKIFLWMDSDQAGKVASENFAKVSQLK